jgi:hypothetical protein
MSDAGSCGGKGELLIPADLGGKWGQRVLWETPPPRLWT